MDAKAGQRKVGWTVHNLKVDKKGGMAKSQKVVGMEMERNQGIEGVTG